MLCPACNGPSHVLATRSKVNRTRQCKECKTKWLTVETFVQLVEPRVVVPKAPKPRKEKRRKKGASKRPQYDVPPEKMADWKTLGYAGFSVAYRARTLGVPLKKRATIRKKRHERQNRVESAKPARQA